MRKSKFITLCKRTMAMVLALMMTLTTFVDGSFVSYAADEASSLAYTGTEVGNELHIYGYEFTEDFPFNEANVMAILNSKTTTYDSIYIQYPDQTTTSVSADLWNAAVNRLNPDYEDRYVQYAFIGEDCYNMDWGFQKPVTTDTAVTMKVDISIGSSMTVNYASTTFPAEFASLNLNTDSQTGDYAAVTALFGTEVMNLEYVDAAGNVITDCGRYDVGSWTNGDGIEVYSSHIQMRPLSRLTAGTTYTLQESVYKGEINIWTDGKGYTRTNLYIGWGGAGNREAMTAQNILDILAYHEGTAFDEITIEQPASSNVIYKDVVNGAIDYLKTTGNQSITWNFNDFQNTKSCFQWILRVPSQMSADQTVSHTVGADAENAPYIMIGDFSNLNAEQISGHYWARTETTVAGYFREYLGDSNIELSVGESGTYGNYGLNDDNVWLNFYDLSGLTTGVKYTLSKKAYEGDEWTGDWNGGTECFEILYHQMVNNGETFNEVNVLNILNKKAQAGSSYHRISLFMPEGTTTVSADVWNALVDLLKTEISGNQGLEIQLGIDGGDSHNTYWTFMWPTHTDEAITLEVNKNWSTDQNGVEVSFPRVNYPAETLILNFETNTSEKLDTECFINAFGTENISLEMVDADGNVVSTNGSYNVNFWDNGRTTAYSLNFSSVLWLNANETYRIQREIYRGDVHNNPDGTSLNISYGGFERAGQEINDENIIALLQSRQAAGEKFRWIHIQYPVGAEKTVSKEVWNQAYSLLDLDAEGVSFEFGFESEDSFVESWSFNWPEPTETDITMGSTIAFQGSEGMDVAVANVEYPADGVWLHLNTNTYDSATSAAFIDAFGSEHKRLEIIDADGNVVENTNGNYNVDTWTDYMDQVITEYSVHIGNIMHLTPGTTYRVQEHVYRGDIHSWEDNGVTYYQLNINPWGAGKEGAAFTKDELIAIIQANAGKEYTEIYIDQAFSSENIIYKDVVNEARNILDQDDRNKLNFNFVNFNTGYGYGVGLENPSAMTADQVVSFELGLKNDKATVTINNTFDNVNAEWLNIHSFMPYDSEMGTVFREIYGEGRYNLILEETGHSAYYEANEDSVWFDVYDMADLEAGTYTFTLEDYKGDVYGNDEYLFLNIDWGRFADYDLEYSEEAVVAILEDWAAIGEQFNGVHITYPSKDDTVVSKEVWNIAAALIKEDADGRYEETPYLSIMFDDYETYGVEWRIQQPWESGKDVNLKATVTFSTDGSGVGLKFANSDYPAPSLDYIIYSNTYRSDTSLFTGALGDAGMNIRLSLNGKATEVEGGYRIDHYDEGAVSYSMGLNGVQGLKTTVTYKVEEKPYAGFVESWGDEEYETTCLNINPWDAGKEGAMLSEEFIIEVLSRNEGNLFDQIYVEQPASESNVISAAVVNAAKEFLKADGEKLLKFGFVDYDNGTTNEIWLRDPSEQAEDRVVTAYAAVDEAGVPYLHAGNLEGLGSTDITLWHAAPFEGEEGTALLNYFEFSRAITAKDTDLEGSFNANDDQVWIHIGNIYEVEADRNYTLVNKVYKGDIEGDNQEFLSIYWWRFEETGESFCDEEVLKILQERAAAGEKFDQVFIGYPSQVTAVPKDIWNAAVQLLNEVNEENPEVMLQIALENGEVYDHYWIFRNPTAAEEDVQFAQPEISLVPEQGVLISFDRNEFPAAKTIYQLNTYSKREEFIKTFGEEHMYLDVVRNDNPNALVEPNTRGYYGVDEWSAWVMVGDVAALDVNTKYQVQEYVYRGEIFEDGRVLDIRASELGKATITSEDLGNIVGYYFKRGMSFECINVFQDYTKNNVISKSVINFLRNILNLENGELRFVFDRSEETETDYFVDEISWTLCAPGMATKDINANITFTTTANQGAVMKFNANDYAATQVFVSLHTNKDSSFGRELAASLGEAPVFIEGESEPDSRLAALKKGTELVEYVPIHYQNYDDHIYLDVVEVRELAAGVNYTLLPRTFIEDTMEVGVSYDMTEQLSHVPEGKVTWKSFTQDVADITAAGVFTAANEGEFYVMATYKSEGKTYTEMLYGYAAIVLKDIAFEYAAIEMELYPNAEYNTNFVRVLAYPANAWIDPYELEWSVTGDDIITLQDGGNFTATGLGTAVITATVPGTDISASCEVKVIDYTRVSDEVVEALDKLYIVTNFDSTLADIKLPAGCEWKEPATKLNTYVGLTSGTFPVLYTASNGRTIELSVQVRIMTIKDIHMYLANSGSMYFKRGSEDAVFAYDVEVTNGTFEDIKNHKAFDSLIVKPTGMVSTAEVSGYAEDYPDCFVLKTTESTKTGKTTLKLDLVYKGKSIANDSFVIYVTKDYVSDFEGFELAVEDDNDGNANTAILVLKFADANYYFKPTVKCTDTAILKLGKFAYPTAAEIEAAKANGTALEIRIPFTEVKAGDAGIEITLADEVKSKRTYIYTVFDRQPKAMEPSYVINTKYDINKAPISIQYTDCYGIHSDYSENPVTSMDDRFRFEYLGFDSEAGRVYGYLSVKDGQVVKDGTYSVKLYTPVDITFDKDGLLITDEELLAAHSEQYVTVKVKVSNAVPSVTVKQTEKVNLFFDQSAGSDGFIPEGSGELILTTKKGYIENVSMTGTNDFKLADWGDYCVIYYQPDSDGVIDKTATLTYTVIDYEFGSISNQTKNITIATANKAPSVKLTQKSDTLYPGYNTSWVYVYDDNSGKYIQMDEISWVKSAKEIIPIALGEEGTFISTAKSDYIVRANGAEVVFELVAGSNTTDKIKLRIKQDEWSKPVDVTYSITTKWTAPKIKLTSSKLTLNVNEEVYQNQVAGTYILLDGYQDLPYGLNVRFTGTDAKSKAVLNDQIMLSYEYDQIVARFNIDPKDDTRPSGSYKFKVWVDNGMFETSTTLTVNVVNQPVAKNVKLTKSGSIDVLRRDTTCLTYKPKLTNLSGWVVDAYLIGANSDKFYAEWSWWNGGINVYAYEGAELSTSVNYKLTFELVLQNDDGSVYYITTPAQSVKVTQGKPKVTFNSYEGTTLYKQAGNSLSTYIYAAIKDEYVEIENVTLANYTSDLELTYDKENQIFTLSRQGWYEINKSGKIWSLKLNVTFVDQAGNVKDTQVTYKVKVQ